MLFNAPLSLNHYRIYNIPNFFTKGILDNVSYRFLFSTWSQKTYLSLVFLNKQKQKKSKKIKIK